MSASSLALVVLAAVLALVAGAPPLAAWLLARDEPAPWHLGARLGAWLWLAPPVVFLTSFANLGPSAVLVATFLAAGAVLCVDRWRAAGAARTLVLVGLATGTGLLVGLVLPHVPLGAWGNHGDFPQAGPRLFGASVALLAAWATVAATTLGRRRSVAAGVALAAAALPALALGSAAALGFGATAEARGTYDREQAQEARPHRLARARPVVVASPPTPVASAATPVGVPGPAPVEEEPRSAWTKVPCPDGAVALATGAPAAKTGKTADGRGWAARFVDYSIDDIVIDGAPGTCFVLTAHEGVTLDDPGPGGAPCVEINQSVIYMRYVRCFGVAADVPVVVYGEDHAGGGRYGQTSRTTAWDVSAGVRRDRVRLSPDGSETEVGPWADGGPLIGVVRIEDGVVVTVAGPAQVRVDDEDPRFATAEAPITVELSAARVAAGVSIDIVTDAPLPPDLVPWPYAEAFDTEAF